MARCLCALDRVAWTRGEDFAVRGAEVVEEDFVEGEFFRVDQGAGEEVLEDVAQGTAERGEDLVLLGECSLR